MPYIRHNLTRRMFALAEFGEVVHSPNKTGLGVGIVYRIATPIIIHTDVDGEQFGYIGSSSLLSAEEAGFLIKEEDFS